MQQEWGGRQGAGRDYAPIGDYALIGDCHGAALVSKAGSIDWCCLGRFDAAPIFCRILDAARGGAFSLAPSEGFEAQRAYLEGTNILVTRFQTASGSVVVEDFMPVGRRPGSGVHDYVHLVAPGQVVRLVTGVSGSVEVAMNFRPSRDYARAEVRLEAAPGHIRSGFGPVLHHPPGEVEIEGDTARGRWRIGAGETRAFVLSAAEAGGDAAADAARLRAITRSFWSEWIGYCRYDGPHRAAVRRSALALKLLTFAPTGAIVAAPTTSLPEEIGGTRNWDYRFCWLRDSVFALYALAVIGYGGEARRFSDFLGLACKDCAPDIAIMYGIGGETELPEVELTHLSGYRDSAPVRIGNGAHDQRQMDVFGEMLDWADIYCAIGGRFDDASKAMHASLADHVAESWQEPDQGLWEMRGPPLHHVHSKIMAWVTLDRAIKLYGERAGWAEARDAIAAEVARRGIDEAGHLKQTFEHGGVDAAALTTPMLGFPLPEGVMEATVAAVERELGTGDLLHRYRAEDGLPGGEGAFLICSFWMVDALLAIGRAEDAEALFVRLEARANDVDLFSEEIEPESGAFLGNFPQAFTHLALIAAAAHLELHRRKGAAALAGSYADRAKRLVEATFGWRGVLAAIRATGRVGRIRSSRASILEDRGVSAQG